MSDGRFPFVVEAMQMEDIEAVMLIERQSFPLPWSMATYQHEIRDNQHSRYLVVRPLAAPARPEPFWARWIKLARPQRPPVLGYGGFWLVVDEAHISTIATAPAWRGRGLGELLLLSMIEQGLDLGARIVTLEVRVTNIVAQNLYKKYDFAVVGQRKHYYRDNGEDAYIMTVDKASSHEYVQQLQSLRAALWARLDSQRKASLELSGQNARL